MARTEKLIIDGKTLSEIFDKSFMEKISKLGKNIFPVNAVFIYEIQEKENKQSIPIIINHNSRLEIENKVLHVECVEPVLLESIGKIIEGD